MENFEENQKNYEQMSVPFETAKDAEKAMADFHSAVAKLRTKYRIAETVALTQVYYFDGENLMAMSSSTTGGDFRIAADLAYSAAHSFGKQFAKALSDQLQEARERLSNYDSNDSASPQAEAV